MPKRNRVDVIGHLGSDPKMREIDGGHQVASFSIATTDRVKDRATGEWRDGHTEWHNIVAWDKLAGIASTLRTGNACHVIGRLRTRSWDTPDGVKHYITEIIASEVYKLDYQRGGGNRAPHPADAADQYDDLGDLGPPLDMDAPLSPGD